MNPKSYTGVARGTGPCAPEKMPACDDNGRMHDIPSQINEMEKALGELNKSVDEFGGMLASVLRAEPDTACLGGTSIESLAPLANTMREHVQGVWTINSRLTNILKRLEL
jgi:hypothetical protein